MPCRRRGNGPAWAEDGTSLSSVLPAILGETENKQGEEKAKKGRKMCHVTARGSCVPGTQETPLASEAFADQGSRPKPRASFVSQVTPSTRIPALTAEGNASRPTPRAQRPGPRPKRAVEGPAFMLSAPLPFQFGRAAGWPKKTMPPGLNHGRGEFSEWVEARRSSSFLGRIADSLKHRAIGVTLL